MNRRTADRVIDDAHSAIAGAEMGLQHAYTDGEQDWWGEQLAQAQRYLARAIAARDAWDAQPHDDDDESVYPYVPRTDSNDLFRE